jgi:Predicted membrane protein
MGIIGWIIIGALAGWIASMITGNNARMGAGANILVGIAGGFIGGLIMNLVGGYGITGFDFWSLLVATLGAVVLLLIVNAFGRRSRQKDR